MSSLRTLLLPTTLSLLLCTCGEPEPDANDCRADLLGNWESVNEFSCPLVDPTCTYRHTLEFDGSNFTWIPDNEYMGSYTCDAGMVEALEGTEVAFTATYDATNDTLELTWEGLTAPEPYRRVMP